MPTAEPHTVHQVAVPTPVYGTFDYLPPHGIDARDIQAGVRLRVFFGCSQASGFVMAINKVSRSDPRRLRPAIAALDPAPVSGQDLLALGQWAAHYYHHPIGEVFATLLPALLRHGKPSTEVADRYWRLTAAGRAIGIDTLGRAPRQAALLRWLQTTPGVDTDQLAAFDDGARATLRTLLNKGWVEECAIPTTISPLAAPALAVTLIAAQRDAVELICALLAGYAPFVLEGVTGSCKTEVYLDVIDRVAAAGAQALVLVPEIGLTPQWVARFAARLHHPMVVMHAGLTDRQRLRAWSAAAAGEAKVIIGTRSTKNTPQPQPEHNNNDEEHDLSFKQQDGFRYHARNNAVWRANQLNIPIVLGSAPPTLETLYNVERERYQTLSLPQRAGDARPPTLRIVDVRHQPLVGNLSELLLANMSQHLKRGQQVLLFLT